MTMDPYRHEHSHVVEISWSRLGQLLVDLAESVHAGYSPEVVIGVAKGGVIPAAFISSAFLVDLFPIKLSSRHNEQLVSDQPIWHVHPTEAAVRSRQVLLVDDICVAGRTLAMATRALVQLGAAEVRTATLAVHDDSVRPDFTALVTDALIVWPWDRDTLSSSGQWSINAEYLQEMREVPGYEPGPSPMGHRE
jgi:hypoxanthine phosphoribosyltransferase